MTPDPQAPEEIPPEEQDQLASKRFVSNLVKLNFMKLKDELEIERQQRHNVEVALIEEIAGKKVNRAIEDFKDQLRREQREQSSAQSEAKWKRTMEWQNRLLCALAGFVISLAFLGTISRCNHLNDRINALESKPTK